MTCNLCDGTGFVIVVRNGLSAAKACQCRKPKESQQAGPPVTTETAMAATEALCDVLDFAPTTKLGRMLVSNALISMCPTDDSVWWLIQRATQLYRKWPDCGIPGLRQIICSRMVPKDGFVISSTDQFPDGIPSENPQQQEYQKLPAGQPETADLEFQQGLRLLADAKRMPAADADQEKSDPKTREV